VKRYLAPEFAFEFTFTRLMNATSANTTALDETTPGCWYLSESQHHDTSVTAPARLAFGVEIVSLWTIVWKSC
jgi:hypothetical protein